MTRRRTTDAAPLAACGGGSSGEPAAVASGEPIGFEQLAEAATSSADATNGCSRSGRGERRRLGRGILVLGRGCSRHGIAARLVLGRGVLLRRAAGGLFAGLGVAEAGAPDVDDPAASKIDVIRDGTVTCLRFPAMVSQVPGSRRGRC